MKLGPAHWRVNPNPQVAGAMSHMAYIYIWVAYTHSTHTHIYGKRIPIYIDTDRCTCHWLTCFCVALFRWLASWRTWDAGARSLFSHFARSSSSSSSPASPQSPFWVSPPPPPGIATRIRSYPLRYSLIPSGIQHLSPRLPRSPPRYLRHLPHSNLHPR